MLLSNAIATAFLGLSLVSAAVLTDVTVLADLVVVIADIASLTLTVEAYYGSSQNDALLDGLSNLSTEFETTATDTESSDALDAVESTAVITEVATMTLALIAALDDLKANANLVDEGGITLEAVAAVVLLQTWTDAFFVALELKVSTTDDVTAVADKASIDAAFLATITTLTAALL